MGPYVIKDEDFSQSEDDEILILNDENDSLDFDELISGDDLFTENVGEMSDKNANECYKMAQSAERLNGKNYSNWAMTMKVIIQVAGASSVIEEGFDANLEANKTKDNLVYQLLVLSIDGELKIQLVEGKGRKSWDALKEFCHPDSIGVQARVVKEITHCLMQPGDDMRVHISKLMSLFAEVEQAGFAFPPKLQTIMLMNSVSDEYAALTTVMGSWTEKHASMTVVKSKLIEEYDKLSRRRSDVALKISSRLGPKVHKPYNPKFETRKCHNCNKVGHISFYCPLKNNDNNGNDENKKSAKFSRGSLGDDFMEVYSSCFIVNSTNNCSGWILDSGSTFHCTFEKEMLEDFDENFSDVVEIADGKQIHIRGKGNVLLTVKCVDGHEFKWKLMNVMFAPEFSSNLVSVHKLTAAGFSVTFDNKVCMITGRKLDDSPKIIGKFSNGTYVMNTKTISLLSKSQVRNLCVHEWHKILAHRNLNDIKLMKNDIFIRKCNCNDVCESCLQGKSTRKSFPKTATPCTELLELIVSDVCGPMKVSTLSGSRYFMTFIDAFSGYTFVEFLKTKDQVVGKVKNFVEMIKTQKNATIKKFRCDQGSEYVNNELKNYFAANGIIFQCTAGYSPEQNGISEKKNRTLVESARTMLIDSKLSPALWGEAINYACYVQNRIPYKNEKLIPYETFYGSKAKLDHLEVFGCDVYTHIPKQLRKKFDSKAQKMKFVGIDMMSKAYRLFDGHHVRVSRDVSFLKDKHGISIESDEPKSIENHDYVNVFDFINLSHQLQNNDCLSNEVNTSSPVLDPAHHELSNENSNEIENSVNNTNNSELPENQNNNNEISSSRFPSRLIPRIDYKRFFLAHSMLQPFEPKTYFEAINCEEKEKWIAAMKEEIKSLNSLNSWEKTTLPESRKAIGCKWVFKIKTDENGNVERYKARLVAQGFSQKYGIDYDQIFSPVGRPETFRLILVVAGVKKFMLKQFDIQTAFLNGNLKEEIYMKQPEGFNSGPDVYRLRKSLYGLKQAARVWNETLTNSLFEAGAKQSLFDPCLFSIKENNDECYILIHVDDILVATNSQHLIDKLENTMNKSFVAKNLGDAKQYLGIKITKSSDGFFEISQPNYIEKIIRENGLENCNPSKYPIDTGYHKLEDKNFLQSNHEYRSIIGSLLYLANNSRPDISVYVSILSRHVENPREVDMIEAKRIIRYLKGTMNLKLKLATMNTEFPIVSFVDADYAEDRIDRKSMSGFLCFVLGGLISWRAKKQGIVTLSTAEAEYVSISEGCQELTWIQNLCKEFGIDTKDSLIFSDNQSAIALTNGKCSHRTKHIDVRYHYVRDLVNDGTVTLDYKATNENLADMLTKPLNSVKLKQLREGSGLS